MGNAVCTDSHPQPIRDIFSAPKVAAEKKILFGSYRHNLKAWSFGHSPSGLAVNNVYLTIATTIDPGKCYVVVHTQRMGGGEHSPSPDPILSEDPFKVMPLQHTAWAVEAGEKLSPRGLAEPSSVDLSDIGWRSALPFTYSVHLLSGRNASPIVRAYATQTAIEIERFMVRNPGAAERLFYNSTDGKNAPEPVRCIGIRGAVQRSSPAQLRQTAKSNALFRIIHDLPRAGLSPEPTGQREPSKFAHNMVLTGSPADHAPPPPRPQVQELRTNISELAPTPRQGQDLKSTVSSDNSEGATRTTTRDRSLSESGTPILPVEIAQPQGAEEEDLEDRAERLKQMIPCATEILEYLFVGGENPAQNCELLLETGITHVVNAASICIPNYFPSLFEYVALPLGDDPREDILSLFPHVVAAIERARSTGGKVYVHCQQGVSRSCSFVIAYLMWKKGWSYDVAYRHVRARRTVCHPNVGFYINLLRWETQLASPEPRQLWSFLPFSQEHLFPLVFRAAKIEPSKPLLLDPRTCHAAVMIDAQNCDPLCLLRGNACANELFNEGKAELQRLLQYGFYTNERAESMTDKGKKLIFTPAVTKNLSPDTSTYLVEEGGGRKTATAHAALRKLGFMAGLEVKRRPENDTVMNALAAGWSEYAKQLSDENLASSGKAEQRKRKREELAGEKDAKDKSPSPEAGAEDGTPGEVIDESGDPLSVFQLPEFEPVSFIDYEDFMPDCVYLVVYRGSTAKARKDQAWIWIGGEVGDVDVDTVQGDVQNWTRAAGEPETASPRDALTRFFASSDGVPVIDEGEEPPEFMNLF